MNLKTNHTNESQTNLVASKTTLFIVERHMSVFGPYILTTLGIIGNILSIFIFLSPRYRRQSSHFYLLSLALSDLCFLIINLIEDTFRNHSELYRSRINILDRSSPLICIFVQYVRNTTRLLSSWIIVSFTIERLLVVFYPLKRAIICRRKIARFVVLVLILVSLLSNINIPFQYGITSRSTDLGEQTTICDILPEYRRIYMKFAISSMISVYLVPMCTIGIVNMLICCKLWRKSLLTVKDDERASFRANKGPMGSPARPMKAIERINQTKKQSSNECQLIRPLLVTSEVNTSIINGFVLAEESQELSKTYSGLSVSSQNPLNAKSSSDHVKTYIQSRTNRVTMTLLLVSCSFLLLNTPYCAVWMINYINRFGNPTWKSIKEITELFMLTNFCINFLLYCVSGKVFRSELAYLIRCRFKELYDRNEVERHPRRKSKRKDEFKMPQSKSKRKSRNVNFPVSL